MKKLIPVFVLIALGLTVQSSFAGSGGLPSAPDAGSTALLLGATIGGLSWVCKRVRR